jgi:hypothetical protein
MGAVADKTYRIYERPVRIPATGAGGTETGPAAAAVPPSPPAREELAETHSAR